MLETYKFISYDASIELRKAVRIVMQLILENANTIKVKTVEVDDGVEMELMSPFVQEALGDIPLIQPEIIVLSKRPIELSGITVEDKKLVLETGCLLVICPNVLSDKEVRLHTDRVYMSRFSFHHFDSFI